MAHFAAELASASHLTVSAADRVLRALNVLVGLD